MVWQAFKSAPLMIGETGAVTLKSCAGLRVANVLPTVN